MDCLLFLSYAHVDMDPVPGMKSSRPKEIVDDILYELGCRDSRCPFKIWQDVEGVNAGENHRNETRDAIEKCNAGIVLLTPAYMRSRECKIEFSQLLKLKKQVYIVETDDLWTKNFENELTSFEDGLTEDIGHIVRIAYWGNIDGEKTVYGWRLPSKSTGQNHERYNQKLNYLRRSIEGFYENLKQSIEMEESELGSYPPLRSASLMEQSEAAWSLEGNEAAWSMERNSEGDDPLIKLAKLMEINERNFENAAIRAKMDHLGDDEAE